MATRRLRRPQQVERNREQLLAAARRVFLERGFQAATLEAIADAAGFSKGVVYSQFDSKADLFLALLERRIDERAAENARVATAAASVTELLETARRATAAEPAWNLLVLEFRVHAARVPELNARYAALHARTVERLAAALREASRGSRARADVGSADMASFVLACAAGNTLESLVARRTTAQEDQFGAMIRRALDARSRARRNAARDVTTGSTVARTRARGAGTRTRKTP